jgi:GDP-fucose transporter C1
VFNIFCLQLVDASYFQVARGLTLPMTVVLTAITSRENPTREVIISCGLVTWGFTYSFIPVPWLSGSTPSSGVIGGQHGSGGGSGGEAPVLGMILGVFSAAMVAIHAVLVKAALRHVEGRALDLAYWQNALSAIALIPAILISGELWGLLRLLSGTEGELGAFVSGSLITVSTARNAHCSFGSHHTLPRHHGARSQPWSQTHSLGPRPTRCHFVSLSLSLVEL